jgi:hypothetical protein
VLVIRALDGGRLEMVCADPMVGQCLSQIPAILAHRDSAGIRERLHPDPLPNDAARNAEWHRLMDADLRHLFESAQKTVERDLEGFEMGHRRLEIPADHLRAWMSAVNQARIVLSEQHQFDEQDMERGTFSNSPRDRALLQAHLLGYVMQALVEHALEGS